MSPNGDQNANLADHYSRMDYENDDEFVRDNAGVGLFTIVHKWMKQFAFFPFTSNFHVSHF